MTRERVSRIINIVTGGGNIIFCHRVYIQARIWGGFWIPLQRLINHSFFIVFRESNHVKKSFIWQERSLRNETEIQSDQESTS